MHDAAQQDFHDDHEVGDSPVSHDNAELPIPEPVFPSLDLMDQGAGNRSWLAKLNPKLAKPAYTKDQIIDFYCQVGDVQL